MQCESVVGFQFRQVFAFDMSSVDVAVKTDFLPPNGTLLTTKTRPGWLKEKPLQSQQPSAAYGLTPPANWRVTEQKQ